MTLSNFASKAKVRTSKKLHSNKKLAFNLKIKYIQIMTDKEKINTLITAHNNLTEMIMASGQLSAMSEWRRF